MSTWWRKTPIYLAGGLFNAGEQVHNLLLEKYMKELGYAKIILPQRKALSFKNTDGTFDLRSIQKDCSLNASNKKYLIVANTDGPDTDSGTAVEYGEAISSSKRGVVYRTDLREGGEDGSGINIMLTQNVNGRKTVVVRVPSFLTDLSEIETYYRELVFEIDHAILQALE